MGLVRAGSSSRKRRVMNHVRPYSRTDVLLFSVLGYIRRVSERWFLLFGASLIREDRYHFIRGELRLDLERSNLASWIRAETVGSVPELQ